MPEKQECQGKHMGCSGQIFIFLHVKVEPKQQLSCDVENAVIHNLEKSIANSINSRTSRWLLILRG